MEDIVFVSPQLYLRSHRGVEGRDEEWERAVATDGFVPILKSDVGNFTKQLSSRRNDTWYSVDERPQSDVSMAENGEVTSQRATTSEDEDLKYVELNELNGSFVLALSTVKTAMNKNGWTKLFQLLDSDNLILNWSFFKMINKQVVFIAFGNQECCTKFTILIRELVNALKLELETIDWEIHGGDGMTDAGHVTAIENVSMIKECLTILQDSQNSINQHENLRDDESIEYRVDLTTLSDIPPKEIDQLVKDIKNFRTRVLTIEKQKKLKQQIDDNKKMKFEMQKVLDKLNKSNSSTSNNYENDSDENLDDEEDETDEDLLKRQLESELEQSNANYQKLLQQLHTVIEPRWKFLYDSIQKNIHYSNDLIKNRSLHLKELQHITKDPYYHYDHNRSVKFIEESNDNKDRQLNKDTKLIVLNDENKSIAVSNNTNITVKSSSSDTSKHPEPKQQENLKIKLAFKNKIENYQNQSDSEIDEYNSNTQQQLTTSTTTTKPLEETASPQSKDFASRVQPLKDSKLVDELVKEFLGVYEPDLVDYIFENITTHQDKNYLLKDLIDTFDDDAIQIVEKIWSHL